MKNAPELAVAQLPGAELRPEQTRKVGVRGRSWTPGRWPAAKTMTAAQELRQLVKARFFPHVEARGFVRASSTHPQFSVFRRFARDKVQVLNVQWDKYGAPRFLVNFGEGPKEGVRLWGRHVAGEVLEPQDCPESGRLQRKRGPYLRCWFQLNKPLLEALRTMERRYSAETVVDQLVGAFPEVEAWWENRTVGAHLDISPPDMWKVANAASQNS
jgi:hypothetical protein